MSDAVSQLELNSQALQRVPVSRLKADTEAAVQRYPLAVRREVRRLVRSSARMADLATVFPGILFALAARRFPLEQRMQATALIENGAQLKLVARALDLPLKTCHRGCPSRRPLDGASRRACRHRHAKALFG